MTPSYEVKFLVEVATADAIVGWARAGMTPDAHGEAGVYGVETVYLDTRAFDVYHRARELGGAKCRIRRYGTSGQVFLERKLRRGNQVQKLRTEVEGSEVVRRMRDSAAKGWGGAWFRDEVEARGFQPVCRVSYVRTAFFGASDLGEFRLTLDRRLRAAVAREWAPVPGVGEWKDVLGGKVVCEMKFPVAMPQPLKGIVVRHGMSPVRTSKYRRACPVLGLVPAGGALHA